MSRRGVEVTFRTGANGGHGTAIAARGASRSRSGFCAASCIHAGISSVNSSKKYSAIRSSQQREAERFARGEKLIRASNGEIAHALDHGHALGDGDRAASVERVERMRALQREVV